MVAERRHGETVAAAGGNVADGDRDTFRDIPLAPVGGPERHRRRRVEDEPRLDGTFGDVEPDVRLACARGHVPVDAAYVVAELVRPHLSELGAVAEGPGAVVAGEQVVDALTDRQLEVAQQRAGRRARAWTAGRANRRQRRGGTHATAPRARSTWGISTVSRTRSSTVSASTPSASAS